MGNPSPVDSTEAEVINIIMLKIAHLESSIHMGGQELRILDQIRWMLKEGHAAWLLARKDSAIYKEACRMDLPAHPISFRGSANPGAIRAVQRFIKAHGIQLLDCHSASAASSALLARLLGTPIVRTLHYDFKTDPIHAYLLRHGSDHFITVSHWLADKLKNSQCSGQQMISVIPTGIDLNKFDPEVGDRSFRQEFNISDKAIVISAIAMIRPDKGQKYLIRSVDRIVDIHPETYFLIVGSATRKDFLYEIQSEIATLRHRDSVILTGFRRDPQKIIAASDVIVNTSLFEPRSQVIHQAFAMKKLVIASDTGGNQESISHGQTGFLFRSESVENLSQTILTVLDHHKEQIEQIRERAYQAAILEHGIDIMMEKTINIYRKVIETGRSLPELQRRRYAHEELTSE